MIVEKYLWQGMTRLLAIYNGSDNLLIRFEYADARMPVAMTAGGATYYLGYDQVGTLKTVADASGNVVKRVVYDSFGNIIEDTNQAFAVPFGFAGGLHDRDTGLVRFGYRDYDPDTGRWTAKDPIGFAGGDTDLYGYCLSDPVNWTDPSGNQAETVIVRTGILVISAIICAIQQHKDEIAEELSRLWNWLWDKEKDAPCSMMGAIEKGQNYITDEIRKEAQATGKDPCDDILKERIEAAKSIPDKKQRKAMLMALKEVGKFLNCRHHRGD